MNKNQIRHKCGYCGWLFSFSTNFLLHECFKHYVEDEDRIYVDENYVVTMHKTKTNEEDPISKDTLDELLIGAVKTRKALYDHRIPAFERSNLRKNALWTEVSNTLGGALSPEEAKNRWKYLRDNYTKARKKVRSYIPSGSAAEAASALKKPKFRFYDVMTFLNDVFETRQTISSLPDDITENEICRTREQDIDDIVASSSESTDISAQTPTIIHTSPTRAAVQTSTSTLVPARTSTSNVLPQTALHATSQIPTTKRKSSESSYTADYDLEVPRQTPKKQKTDALQAALIGALKEPTVQTTDPLDGFLARLGEGMRRLPYRVRARLEIEFLTLLAEKEDLCDNNYNDSIRDLST